MKAVSAAVKLIFVVSVRHSNSRHLLIFWKEIAMIVY